MIRRALGWILSSIVLLPFPVLILLSLARRWPWPEVLPRHLQVQHWLELLVDARGLGEIILRSFAMGIGVAVTATTLGFACSRGLARHRHRDRLTTLLYLPFAVSPVVLGVSLLYAFLRLHLAGHVLGVMLAQLIIAYAYAVLLLSAFWNRRIEALAELASSLGATPWQLWSRALVPMARPLLAVCLFQTFLISWFDYALALVIGSSQISTVTTALYQYFGSGDLRLAATCSLLLILPPLFGLALNRRLLSAPIAMRLEDIDD